jgi:hypothetical protein
VVGSRDGVGRLGRWEQAAWVLNLYPTAGEASGCFVAVGGRRAGGGVRGLAADPERAALEGARRARAFVRRYAAANGLTRFGTLTYRGEGCFDQTALRVDLAAFFRGVRAELGGPVPYLWVPEWHKTHGLHAHFALDQFAHQRMLERVWGHGHVSIKRLSGARAGDGSWQSARIASGYLAKYVTKTFVDAEEYKRRLFGLHRYEPAQGFKPPVKQLRGTSWADLMGEACDIMGGRWSREWFSNDVEGWRAPPAYWFQWGTRR